MISSSLWLAPAFFSTFFIVWLSVAVVGTGLWIWMLVDACQRPDWVYTRTGSSKTTWILVIALIGGIGALVYLFAERPMLVSFMASHDGGNVQAQSASPAGASGGICARCGSPVALADAHCPRCGMAVERAQGPANEPLFCTSCGQPASSGNRFCGQCGQPVGGPAGPVGNPQATRAGLDPVTGLELATWGRRAGAYVVDLIVVMIPLLGITIGTGVAMARTVVHPDGSTTHGDSFVGALVIIAEVVVCSIAYFGLLNGLTGRTVGLRLLGLEVRDASGVGVIGFWKAAARFCIIYPAAVIPVVGLPAIAVDLLSPLWDKRRQAWHDHMVQSIVLRRVPHALEGGLH